MTNLPFDKLLQSLTILIVDGNTHLRRTTRMMLTNLGVRSVIEAADSLGALEQIRTCSPEVMLLDWDMPVLNGIEMMRIVRTPGVFPKPNLPTIMLTNHAKRSYVLEALRVGVHELLLKPISTNSLRDRLTSVMLNPRPMVKIGEYYVPKPRRMLSRQEPDSDTSVEVAITASA